MALSINTNIASLQAQMNLNKASEAMKQNQERLSTGLRINSAADDAAGLAITDRMTSQIRGLDQAAANANDGISLAKTAEGAMDETTNILQRMRELAVQSANDSNTETDRQSIQDEVNQLISEVDRIAENTTYNTKNVLNGNLENSAFQVGADEGQTIEFGIGSAKADDLGYFGGVNSGNFTMATAQNNVTSDMANVTAGNNLQSLQEGDLTINGTEIRGSQSGDDTVSSTDNASSAIAVAAAINESSDITNVTAKAENTTAQMEVTTGGTTDLGSGDLQINGITIAGTTTANAADSTTAAGNLVNVINDKTDQTGVGAEVLNGTEGTIQLNGVDGRNIEVEANSTAAGDLENFTDGDVKVVRGNVSLYSNESFEIGGDNPNVVGFSPGGVELETSTLKDTGTAPSELSGTNDTFYQLQQGDLVIDGESIDANSISEPDLDSASNIDPTTSAAAIANQINNTEGLEGNVEAEAETVANLGKISAYDASASGNDVELTVNGESINIESNIEDGDSTGSLVAALNSGFSTNSSGNVGDLVASVNDDGELLITSEEGVNVDVAVNAGTNSGDVASSDFLGNINTTDSSEHVAAKGTISFTEGNKPDSIEGAAKALAGIEDEDRTVSTLDVTTQEAANNAIESIDKAIEQIDNEKAKLGAIQNRFDSTISNLNNVQQNITEARSRIQDADIAKESSEQTMNQVRRQAASSVLAQANQGPQLAMQLLGG